jgi:flagellar basal-body rod modification protein FlgD
MAIPAIVMSVAGGVLSGMIQKAIAGSGEASAPAEEALDKEDFLRLLTTQLRNQDPLNPLSNADFVAQTAQFSSLEQLQNMNKALERLAAQSGGNGPVTASALLGRTVTVNGSAVNLDGIRPASVGYALPSSASNVYLQVQDASGNVVRTVSLGAQSIGKHQWSFDGLDDAGRRLPAGTTAIASPPWTRMAPCSRAP